MKIRQKLNDYHPSIIMINGRWYSEFNGKIYQLAGGGRAGGGN
jgi:hypothetical protein